MEFVAWWSSVSEHSTREIEPIEQAATHCLKTWLRGGEEESRGQVKHVQFDWKMVLIRTTGLHYFWDVSWPHLDLYPLSLVVLRLIFILPPFSAQNPPPKECYSSWRIVILVSIKTLPSSLTLPRNYRLVRFIYWSASESPSPSSPYTCVSTASVITNALNFSGRSSCQWIYFFNSRGLNILGHSWPVHRHTSF